MFEIRTLPLALAVGLLVSAGLRADPWEMKNLWFNSNHASVVADLQGELLEWLITTSRATSTLPTPDITGPHTYERYHIRSCADGRVGGDQVRSIIANGQRNYM